MTENFLILGKKTDIQARTQKVPKKMNLKRSMPKCIILKMAKLDNFEINKKNSESCIRESPSAYQLFCQ